MNNPTHVVFDSGLRLEQEGVKVHVEKLSTHVAIDVQHESGVVLANWLVPIDQFISRVGLELKREANPTHQ